MSSVTLSFVIDADIARSSGESEHPVSSGSRSLLESVARNGHKAAMCPTLIQEWKKHKSIFATKWLASMIARKKVFFVKPLCVTSKIVEQGLSVDRDKLIALKDSHLVDAALATDKIIASNDSVARDVFKRLALVNGYIGEIAWFNAVSDRDFVGTTLVAGGYIPPIYYLREG